MYSRCDMKKKVRQGTSQQKLHKSSWKIAQSTSDIKGWYLEQSLQCNETRRWAKTRWWQDSRRWDKRNARNLLTILASILRCWCEKKNTFLSNAIMLIQTVMKIQIGWMKLWNDTWKLRKNDLIVTHRISSFLNDEIWRKHHALVALKQVTVWY